VSRYTVYFDWPDGADEAGRDLDADTLDLAKVQAAMLYALWEGPPPDGYRIEQDGEIEVYRYPEAVVH
jgi:hypothetical protein